MHATPATAAVQPRIDVTFHDSAAARRLIVMTRHFGTAELARAAFENLEPIEGFTAFVASMQVTEGRFEHRPLDPQLLEHLTSQSLPALLARARSCTPVVLGTPARTQ